MTMTNHKGKKIMNIIAVEVSNSNHGDFLKSFADAWQRADPQNRLVLSPAWSMLIIKYRLREEYATIIERELKIK